MMLNKLNRFAVISVVAATLSACATMKEMVKEPEVSVSDIQVKAVSLSDMKVDFTLGVKNPNPLGISLSGMRYKLDVDGKSLLSGDSRQKLKVKANSSSQVTLPLGINYKDLAGGIGALVSQDKVSYALSGDLDFGLFRVPYKKKGVLELPSLPEVSVAEVNINRMTLSGMEMTVVLQLENRNSFQAKIEGIRYDLKMAGSSVLSGQALQPLTLKPDTTGQLGIGVNMSYKNLGQVINSLTNSTSVPVAFEGKMTIPGAGEVPLNWHGDVGIRH